MKKVAALMVVALLLIPGIALAGPATDAALGLGAFAVFNQIISGTGVFGAIAPRPVVVAPRPVVVAPALPVYVAPPPPPVVVVPRPVVVAGRRSFPVLGVGGRAVGQGRQRQDGGERDERQQGEEHDAPRQPAGEGAGSRRADHAGDHPGAGEHREDPGPEGRGIGPTHGGVGDRGDHARAHALGDPAGHQHGHGLGRTSHHQAHREQGEAHCEGQPRAPPVRRPARQDDAEQATEEETGEDPAVQAQAP